MEKIRFVCATRASSADFASCALGQSLSSMQVLPMFELRLFAENTASLGEVYNIAIDEAHSQPAILVFIHDDVFLPDFFMVTQIYASLQHFDVVGVAGNKSRIPRQPGWYYREIDASGKKIADHRSNLSGGIAHGKQYPEVRFDFFGPPCQPCKLLDGVFLMARSQTLLQTDVRFDPQFDFHFYDVDFCRQAELKGLRIGTWPISLIHQSMGNFTAQSWLDCYQRYLCKYNE